MSRAAAQRLALLHDRDRRALELVGVRAAAKIGLIARQKAADALKAGNDPAKALRDVLLGRGTREPGIVPLVRDAMVAGHLKGRQRAAKTVAPAFRSRAKIKLAGTAYDDAIDWLTKRLAADPADIAALAKMYEAPALQVARNFTDAVSQRIQSAILDTTREGGGVKDGIKALGQAFEDAGMAPAQDYALETLYRTQTQLAYGAGRWNSLQDEAVQDVLWGYEYVTVGDDRVRETHAAMEGTRAPKDDALWKRWWPPAGYNCFLAGTEVEGAFKGGLKARYAGPAVQIETRRGHRLTVTANHPILTPYGWIAAGKLDEGAALFSDSRNIKGASRRSVQNQDRPALIEDVVQSLRTHRRARTISPQLSPLDFYGDAAFFAREVDVVLPDLMLVGDSVAHVAQRLHDRELGRGDVLQPIGPSFSASELHSNGVLLAASGRVRGRDLTLHRLGVLLDPLPFQPLRFGQAAQWNVMAGEKSSNDGPAHTQFVRQLVDAAAGAISLDYVSRVRKFDFCGHVYDLESETGWILSSGIVSSNCRCSTIEIFKDERIADATEVPDVQPDKGFGFNPGEVYRDVMKLAA